MARFVKYFIFEVILPIGFVVSAFFYILKPYTIDTKPQILGLKSITKRVRVTALVGEYYFNLFGYTSPGALVSLEGMTLTEQTRADATGYFMFANRFSPLASREVCLTAIDQVGRTSVPTCIPPFPIKYNVTVGPVILPPTISLNKPTAGSNYYIGDETYLSGQTIPNSVVNLSLYTDTVKKTLAFIKPVEAFSFPQLSASSDDKGNFSISLPSSSSKTYRLFTTVNYKNELSPKSLTLEFKIKPVWMVILEFFVFLWHFISPYWLPLLILTQILAILIYFYKTRLHPYHLTQIKSLALRNDLSLMKIDEFTN